MGARMPRLVAGTMVSKDLRASRRFYEEFLGFDCVSPDAGHLLLRDQHSKAAMAAGSDDFFVIEVAEVDEIPHPQNVLNHWGIDVSSTQEVDRIHAEAVRLQSEFELQRVKKPTHIHGSYGFYLADRDRNWWEIERRIHGFDNQKFFAAGDQVEDAGVASANAPGTPPGSRLVPGSRPDSIVGGGKLTHGTCEQADLRRARKFLVEVLGIRSIRHSSMAQMLSGRNDLAVVAVGVPHPAIQPAENRWVIDVDDPAAVGEIHRRAVEAQEECGLLALTDIGQDSADEGFSLQDADGNWWQVGCKPAGYYESLFDAGDRA